ncbi:hypothetical protein O181_055020 [Austropuccinia psidii MF-1]|uniref:Uncharacterized protein n=1 Tax=Austropuccinia psidii MF-1 TaxID=1389203 RepID=A0A9Q3HUW0_9BASI|nr:hypothetical protein [Austropuccinia psidii MF-1]
MSAPFLSDNHRFSSSSTPRTISPSSSHLSNEAWNLRQLPNQHLAAHLVPPLRPFSISRSSSDNSLRGHPSFKQSSYRFDLATKQFGSLPPSKDFAKRFDSKPSTFYLQTPNLTKTADMSYRSSSPMPLSNSSLRKSSSGVFVPVNHDLNHLAHRNLPANNRHSLPYPLTLDKPSNRLAEPLNLLGSVPQNFAFSSRVEPTHDASRVVTGILQSALPPSSRPVTVEKPLPRFMSIDELAWRHKLALQKFQTNTKLPIIPDKPSSKQINRKTAPIQHPPQMNKASKVAALTQPHEPEKDVTTVIPLETKKNLKSQKSSNLSKRKSFLAGLLNLKQTSIKKDENSTGDSTLKKLFTKSTLPAKVPDDESDEDVPLAQLRSKAKPRDPSSRHSTFIPNEAVKTFETGQFYQTTVPRSSSFPQRHPSASPSTHHTLGTQPRSPATHNHRKGIFPTAPFAAIEEDPQEKHLKYRDAAYVQPRFLTKKDLQEKTPRSINIDSPLSRFPSNAHQPAPRPAILDQEARALASSKRHTANFSMYPSNQINRQQLASRRPMSSHGTTTC